MARIERFTKAAPSGAAGDETGLVDSNHCPIGARLISALCHCVSHVMAVPAKVAVTRNIWECSPVCINYQCQPEQDSLTLTRMRKLTRPAKEEQPCISITSASTRMIWKPRCSFTALYWACG